MEVIEILKVDAELRDELSALICQLSEAAPEISIADLQRILDTDGCALMVAKDGGQVVGCVTVSVFPVLTDVRAWIDDLVVRASERGRGIGRQLVSHAIKQAKARGARSVNLTCNPDRTSANALYRKMGFTQRSTNVYHHRP